VGEHRRGPHQRRHDRRHGVARGHDPRDVLDAKAYAEASAARRERPARRGRPTKPKVDRHVDSPSGLEATGLQHLRDAVAAIQAKANPDELEDYRRFVVGLAERVAHAHREDGVEISDAERAARSRGSRAALTG
jgi:hypothetical protein